ncbi:flagellar hook-length control protein FliK [Variovorax sp. LARHSF232]
MTSLASLPVVASATPAAAQAASSSARDAQARSGEDFGAALARSRSGSRASDKSEETSAAQPPRRKSIAASGDKEHSPAELLAIALLTPAFLATSPRAAPLETPGNAAAASVAAQEAAAPLPQDPLAAAGAKPSGDEARNALKAEVQAAQVDEAAPKLPGAAGRTEAGKPEAPASRGTEGAAPTVLAALPPAAASSATTPAPAPGKAVAESGKAAATPSPTAIVQQAADAAASQPAEHEDISLASASTPSTSIAPAPALTGLAPAMATAGYTPPAPAAPAHVPVLTVEPPVGSEAWGAAVGQQMIRMSASGEHVAELNLNPAGLGPLKISLTLGDNQAQALFVSAHESVRKVIEAALPQLRSQLADQGISLGQASVDAGTQQQQQQAADRESGFDAAAARRSSAAPRLAGAAEALPSTRAEHNARARAGGVDTFA